MSRTGTETFELQSTTAQHPTPDTKGFVPSVIQRLSQPSSRGREHSTLGAGLAASPTIEQGEPVPGTIAAAANAKDAERWNYPKGNAYRVFSTFWAFMVMGMNDAAYGVSTYRHQHI